MLGPGSVVQEHSRRDRALNLGSRQSDPVKSVWVLFGDEGGRGVARFEPRVAAERGQEVHVVAQGRRPGDHVLGQRLFHSVDALCSVASVRHEFGDHRVVVRADLPPLHQPAVHAHRRTREAFKRSRAGGLLEREERSVGGEEVSKRVLSVHARLERPPVNVHRGRFRGQVGTNGLARCDPKHLLHQVHLRHVLCYRVLHLKAGVHF
mmetsp:Transcript_15517/g.26365  ORF Transcript_15517/g.26365 Transcript_15517/m.26365 type:complete len:207 (+) Transcript_15517:1111-1731(+)